MMEIRPLAIIEYCAKLFQLLQGNGQGVIDITIDRDM